MPWDVGPFSGFSAVEPWLPLNADAQIRNVATESVESGSILTLYRRLIALRRSHRALSSGAYRPLAQSDTGFVYERAAPGERLLVALNFGPGQTEISLKSTTYGGRVLLSTHPERDGEAVIASLTLRPNEGMIISCDG